MKHQELILVLNPNLAHSLSMMRSNHVVEVVLANWRNWQKVLLWMTCSTRSGLLFSNWLLLERRCLWCLRSFFVEFICVNAHLFFQCLKLIIHDLLFGLVLVAVNGYLAFSAIAHELVRLHSIPHSLNSLRLRALKLWTEHRLGDLVQALCNLHSIILCGLRCFKCRLKLRHEIFVH